LLVALAFEAAVFQEQSIIRHALVLVDSLPISGFIPEVIHNTDRWCDQESQTD
jgi:hypothetical protein